VRTSRAGIDPDAPGLTGRIGGPLGRHARVAGVWFDPVPWAFGAAIVVWFFTVLKQVRCLGADPNALPNAASRLCYSDISVLYRSYGNIWSGRPLYGGTQPLEYPVLSGGFIWVTRWLTRLLGGDVSPTADAVATLHASNIFLAVNAVLLFCCFLALVWAHLQMGRNSGSAHTQGVRVRSWDALFLAASPLVIAVGIINWDMFAVALTALAVLAWARRRPLVAGVLIGLACSAKFFPLAIVAVLFILCLRAAAMWTYAKFLTGAVLAWLAANLPLALTNPTGWKYFYVYNATRGADFGSVWHVLGLIGLPVGSVALTVAEVLLIALAGTGILFRVLTAPRRPRVAQVALLVLVAFLIINKVYSPQYALWLLPFVILARPVILDIAVFSAGELAYFFAVFAFIGRSPGDQSLPDPLYWVLVLVRIGVEIWVAMRVLDDIVCPWQDPVRAPLVDDPLGGVLDHAPDAPFLLRSTRRRPAAAASAPIPADAPVVPVPADVPVEREPLPQDAALWAPPSPLDVAPEPPLPAGPVADVPSSGVASPVEEVPPVEQTAPVAPEPAGEGAPASVGESVKAAAVVEPAAPSFRARRASHVVAPAGEAPNDDDWVIEPGTVLNPAEGAEAEPGTSDAAASRAALEQGRAAHAVTAVATGGATEDVAAPAAPGAPAAPAASTGGASWDAYEAWLADIDAVLGPRAPGTPVAADEAEPTHALAESTYPPTEPAPAEPASAEAAPTDAPEDAGPVEVAEASDPSTDTATEVHGAPDPAVEAPSRKSRVSAPRVTEVHGAPDPAVEAPSRKPRVSAPRATEVHGAPDPAVEAPSRKPRVSAPRSTDDHGA